MFVYQLISQVYTKFRGLPVRLAERHNLSDEWFRSWGYKPRSLDGAASGATCTEIENYFKRMEDFESAVRGSGQMLSQLVYAELKCRFTQSDDENCTLRELRHSVLDEAADVLKVLDERDLKDATREDIKRWIKEIVELNQIGEKALGQMQRELGKREVEANQ